MADFVAVLRKTIGSLGDNTPEMRERVYEKARSTIEAKLAALNPPPPAAVLDRQRKALDDAIAVVRADYAAEPEPEPDEDLEDVFASLHTISPVAPKPAPSSPDVEPAPSPAEVKPVQAAAAIASSSATAATPTPVIPPAVPAKSVAVDPAMDDGDEDQAGEMQGPPEREDALGVMAGERTSQRYEQSEGGKRRTGVLVGALVLLLVAAGAGYGIWANRDDISNLVGLGTGTEQPAEVATTADEPAETPAAPTPTAEAPTPATPPEAEEDIAAVQPDAPVAEPAVEAEKFTQRLMPDGSEVDEGPAGGTASVGEGTSISALAQPGEGDTPAAGGEQTAQSEDTPAAAAPADTPGVAVGQRAIFYEERTNSVQGSAEMGSIVWSVVQESPGGDQPAEPAIRAEATIPGKDVQLRMTIRRNGDQTLPASHIVEMIFLTPDGFEGGGISNVSRISFKETEQAPGNPLIGLPARIADGFFLIALGNSPAEIEQNMNLMRRQSWVDIPIVYQSGRRALLTLEKGIPGDRVFQDALRAWDEASSG
ncbi:hypothetical protein [Mesorhizobium sp. CAU 1732]|uniref:hypothetical protein n=1 Tax=Mesorhizobium sp. CAU 1732 TaxID=3140358 RepID=UPI0032602E4C